MHVRIDTNVVATPMRENQDEVRGLAADSRQRQQIIHRLGHDTAKTRKDLLARTLNVHGLVPIEADRIDETFNLLHRQLHHRLWRSRDTEQSRRRGVGDRVLRLCRQHRRDQDLKGIVLLIARQSSRRRALRGHRSPGPVGA